MYKLRGIHLTGYEDVVTCIRIFDDHNFALADEVLFSVEKGRIVSKITLKELSDINFREFSLYSFDEYSYTLYIDLPDYDTMRDDVHFGGVACSPSGTVVCNHYTMIRMMGLYNNLPVIVNERCGSGVRYCYNGNVYEMLLDAFKYDRLTAVFDSDECSIYFGGKTGWYQYYIGRKTQAYLTKLKLASCLQC